MIEKKLISVVSPVYGCRDCLEDLVDRVRDAFQQTNLEWELILVDDRGPDQPWPLIDSLARQDARVRGVKLARNHGQHLAIWAGLAEARGAWVAVIDCDLQDDPAIIPKLYKTAGAQKEPIDVVLVERGNWHDNSLRRIASSVFVNLVTAISGVTFTNEVGNFGLYSRRMVDTLLEFKDKEVFLPLMVSLTGLPQIRYSGLDRSDRASGKSSYNLRRLLLVAVSIIIRFSDRPLQISTIVGSLFSTLAAIISIFIVLGWSMGVFTVPGWTSLVLSVWFLSGLILAVLGVHGFYIGRIFAEVQHRPRIIIDTRTDDHRDNVS